MKTKYRKVICPHCNQILLMNIEKIEHNCNKRIFVRCRKCKKSFSITIK